MTKPLSRRFKSLKKISRILTGQIRFDIQYIMFDALFSSKPRLSIKELHKRISDFYPKGITYEAVRKQVHNLEKNDIIKVNYVVLEQKEKNYSEIVEFSEKQKQYIRLALSGYIKITYQDNGHTGN